mgnify:CR=1 FL=1
MTTIDPTAPVLVTGATGYVAGHVVRRLRNRFLEIPVMKHLGFEIWCRMRTTEKLPKTFWCHSGLTKSFTSHPQTKPIQNTA